MTTVVQAQLRLINVNSFFLGEQPYQPRPGNPNNGYKAYQGPYAQQGYGQPVYPQQEYGQQPYYQQQPYGQPPMSNAYGPSQQRGYYVR